MRCCRGSSRRRSLRYLAVAHYGRGRGEWIETEYPSFWKPLVARIVDARREAFARVWAQRAPTCDAHAIAEPLRVEIAAAAREMLDALYPDAIDWTATAIRDRH